MTEDQTAVSRKRGGIDLVAALVGNRRRVRPVVGGERKLLEDDADLALVFRQQLLLQELMEARAGGALKVGILHDRHRGVGRTGAGLVSGHDDPLGILLKGQNISQDADLPVPRHPNVSGLFVLPVVRSKRRFQKLRESGLGEGTDREFRCRWNLEHFARPALELGLGI